MAVVLLSVGLFFPMWDFVQGFYTEDSFLNDFVKEGFLAVVLCLEAFFPMWSFFQVEAFIIGQLSQ